MTVLQRISLPDFARALWTPPQAAFSSLTSFASSAALSDVSAMGDLIVIGDIHGCLPNLQRALRENGIVNSNNDWIAGNRTVVQVGDMLDRGADDARVIEYVQMMQLNAAEEGGEWVQLMGNHEWNNLRFKFRYAFDSESVWDRRTNRATVAGYGTPGARIAAMKGSAGEWLRNLPVAHQWRDVVFIHADLSDTKIAARGVRGINDHARDFLHGKHQDSSVIYSSLWLRRLSKGAEALICPVVDEV